MRRASLQLAENQKGIRDMTRQSQNISRVALNSLTTFGFLATPARDPSSRITLYGFKRSRAQAQPADMMHMKAMYVESETVPDVERKFNPNEIMEPRKPPKLKG